MISPHVPPLFPPRPADPGGQPVTLVCLTELGSAWPDSSLPSAPEREGADCFEPDPEDPPSERTVEQREGRTVADFMTRPVITARTDQPLREVVKLLGQRRIAGVPVVDDDGRVAGVISQSDIAAHVAESWSELFAAHPARFYQSFWIPESDLHERMSAETPVSQVMSPYVLYATPDSSLDETAELMLKHGVHRVVVLEAGLIVGIVSSLDLLRAYREANPADRPREAT